MEALGVFEEEQGGGHREPPVRREQSPRLQEPPGRGVTGRLAVFVEQSGVTIVQAGVGHDGRLERRLPFLVQQLLALREGELASLVAHPEEHLVPSVRVDLCARTNLDHEHVIRRTSFIQTGDLATLDRDGRLGEVEGRLPPRIQEVWRLTVDPLDPPLPQSDHHHATLGVGESDGTVGQIPGGDPAALAIEPLVLGPFDQGGSDLLTRQCEHVLDVFPGHERTLTFL